jgi:Tfp pilus assembly protein PilN
MIKVNLLQNTVERTSVDLVETAISAKGTQQFLLLLVAFGACVIAAVTDYLLTVRENTRVKAEVQVEEQRAAQLQELIRQATELQNRNKAVEDRINAIQRLRAEQIGPVRLLQMVDSRLPADPNFRLKLIKQGDDENKGQLKVVKPDGAEIIVINGYSPSEEQVTAFAKNLEFSNGLFTNFLIATKRLPNPERSAGVDTELPEGQVVEFVIKCLYQPQTLLTRPVETGGAAPANGPGAPPADGQSQPAGRR